MFAGDFLVAQRWARVVRARIVLLGLVLYASAGAEAARAAPVTVDAPPVMDCEISNTAWSYTCAESAVTAGIGWNGTNQYRGLIRFNLGEVPAGSMIVSAHLYTTPVNTDTWQDQPLGAHQITQSWTSDVDWLSRDGAQLWTTPGGDIGPSVDSAIPCCGQSTWDVTSLVQDWVSGGAPNYGVMLVGTAPETVTDVGGFNSIEWGAGKPRLTITYEADVTPPGSPSFVTATLDAATTEVEVSWNPAIDPPFANGYPGSGVMEYTYRYRRDGGAWSSWADTQIPEFELAGGHNGELIDVEVYATDDVGNVGATTQEGDEAGPATWTSQDFGPPSGQDVSHIEFSDEDEPDEPADALRGADAGSGPVTDPSAYRAADYTEDNCDFPSPCGDYDQKAAAKYARYWFNRRNRDYA